LKGEAGEQNQAEVKLRALDREATAGRTLLRHSPARPGNEQPGELSAAGRPHRIEGQYAANADLPKTKMFMVAGFMGAAIIAAFLAFLPNTWTGASAARADGRGVRRAIARAAPVAEAVAGKSGARRLCRAASGIRLCRSICNLYRLRLSNGEHWPRTVLITSSLPDEGKTTVAGLLAGLLSVTG
jgi:hypothetical protein